MTATVVLLVVAILFAAFVIGMESWAYVSRGPAADPFVSLRRLRRRSVGALLLLGAVILVHYAEPIVRSLPNPWGLRRSDRDDSVHGLWRDLSGFPATPLATAKLGIEQERDLTLQSIRLMQERARKEAEAAEKEKEDKQD